MSKNILLSIVVLAKNEGVNLPKCLKSLSWCDEVLIIDDFSSDKTQAISQKYGASVFKRALNNNFAKQRNFGLTKAKGKWVLFVDADELVSAELAKEIRQKISQSEFNGFHLTRQDWLFGKLLKHGESGQTKLLRLGKKNAGKWIRAVHETWEVKEPVGSIDEPLHHYPHPTVSAFLKHLNFHTSLHARENSGEGKKPTLAKLIFYPIAKFLQNFIFKRGFQDGTPGFMAAMFMSWHSFLSWSKAWTKN